MFPKIFEGEILEFFMVWFTHPLLSKFQKFRNSDENFDNLGSFFLVYTARGLKTFRKLSEKKLSEKKQKTLVFCVLIYTRLTFALFSPKAGALRAPPSPAPPRNLLYIPILNKTAKKAPATNDALPPAFEDPAAPTPLLQCGFVA